MKSSEVTSVRDELKRFEHRLVLEVTVPGEAPFEATVNQVLTFMKGGSPPVGSKLQVRVIGKGVSVYVMGPAH